jgi:predicted DNA-binding protein with PD1-like motif
MMPLHTIQLHAFRLMPGQDLRQEIEAYVQQQNIGAGWIQTCVGSLTQTHLRFANQQTGTTRNGHFEIVSLVGTVSSNGCHLHLCVSDAQGQTSGGHLLFDNRVYTTAEIIIGESKAFVFTRAPDAATGWKELHIENTDLHNKDITNG